MAGMCHKVVAETAKGLCGAEYELNCSMSNDFYKAYPSQKQYIRRHWKNMIPAARKTLVMMLKDNSISDILKDEIADALILDRALPQGDAQAAGLSTFH